MTSMLVLINMNFFIDIVEFNNNIQKCMHFSNICYLRWEITVYLYSDSKVLCKWFVGVVMATGCDWTFRWPRIISLDFI